MLFSGTLEINRSKDIKIQEIIGPCTSLEKKGPAVASTVIGQGNTTAWKMCGLDKSTCLTVFFDVASREKSDPAGTNPQLFIQFLTRYKLNLNRNFLGHSYQSPDGQMWLRVTNVTRRWVDSTLGNEFERLNEQFFKIVYRTGVSWDRKRNAINAYIEVWTELFRIHPLAPAYFYQGDLRWGCISYIFGITMVDLGLNVWPPKLDAGHGRGVDPYRNGADEGFETDNCFVWWSDVSNGNLDRGDWSCRPLVVVVVKAACGGGFRLAIAGGFKPSGGGVVVTERQRMVVMWWWRWVEAVVDYKSSNYFTIKMHHSGRFLEINGRFYIDGQVSFFDFCEPSEMSLSAIYDMARQIGQVEGVVFYFSLKGPDDCSDLECLIHDCDARNLFAVVNRERVVGVYIEYAEMGGDFLSHLESNQPLSPQSKTFVDGSNEENYMSNMIEEENLTNSDSSNDTNAEEEDPEFSDGFQESDYDEDDILYDENIDDEVEWVGIWDKVEQPILTKSHLPVQPKSVGSSQFPIYNDDADLSDFEFDVGLCFKTVSEFREAIRKYAIKQGKPLTFTKNCSDKVQVTCDCGWVILASFRSKKDKTFQVKTIKGEHSCYRTQNAKHCTSKFLADKYQHHLRSNPSWPVRSMQEVMQMENHTNLSTWKMYRTKKKALQLNTISEIEQYSKLWDYCDEIKRTHPDTTIKLKCKHVMGSDTSTFKKLYICWGALKKGFKAGHLYNNFKKDHKGLALKDMLWKAATATRVMDFKMEMERIKAFDVAAFNWLLERPAMNWSRRLFVGNTSCFALCKPPFLSFDHLMLSSAPLKFCYALHNHQQSYLWHSAIVIVFLSILH
ncbi:hypothetical protein BUALT_Bualt14G0026800 [Buddleja alternifolia]|uniref:Transposase MuDR plant domain-containing protein n=1 Tax=Buddleja alternifolia TaxID=168488 RepID=A0AAV6WMA4_9LAMI|nr:hypothetical protein BUALT_Bualt14G0026800 [Buddleja alternifolia]